jgi:hypothetical protein
VTDPRPDPHSERAGETEYGNDTGFADAATRQPNDDEAATSTGTDGETDAPVAPGEPPD